jgi:hypothetical protein
MITLLLVGSRKEVPFTAHPSVELLRCASPDEALETLSRNRRIDAVLFFDAAAAAETTGILAEEGSSWPPLFQVGNSSVPGVVPIDPGSILEEIRRHLGE